jgi:hypothetical protein
MIGKKSICTELGTKGLFEGMRDRPNIFHSFFSIYVGWVLAAAVLLSAGWLELGMFASFVATKNKFSDVEFVFE